MTPFLTDSPTTCQPHHGDLIDGLKPLDAIWVGASHVASAPTSAPDYPRSIGSTPPGHRLGAVHLGCRWLGGQVVRWPRDSARQIHLDRQDKMGLGTGSGTPKARTPNADPTDRLLHHPSRCRCQVPAMGLEGFTRSLVAVEHEGRGQS
jgi:hypothetical protein